MGRPAIDPAIKAERQKECRRMWRLNNRDQFNEIMKKSANKRYTEDPEYRERSKERSAQTYLYKRETSIFRSILI
jgi:hypothetical protein